MQNNPIYKNVPVIYIVFLKKLKKLENMKVYQQKILF